MFSVKSVLETMTALSSEARRELQILNLPYHGVWGQFSEEA